MENRIYTTPSGSIHYMVSGPESCSSPPLVFLPGLTADHRLFEKQLAYFSQNYRTLVWDAPGHAASRPFELNFSLADKAGWLDDILTREGFSSPVFIGQSMGGYVTQAYLQLFPGKVRGFVSIDSCPLGLSYYTKSELILLKHTEAIYRMYPWKTLVRQGAAGCAETAYGQALMSEMMHVYDDDHTYYARLTAHGYRMIAEAVEADLPYN